MKRWLCWLILLLMFVPACAEQTSGVVQAETVSLTVKDCRVESRQDNSQEIRFSWEMRNAATDDMAGYFFDIGDIAYSGSDQNCTWQTGYDLRLGDTDLALGYLPALYDQWVLREEAVLSLTSESGSVEFPLRLAFYVDIYEPIVRTADLRRDKLRWSMVKESDRIYVARPDVPELNGGSLIPRVLADYDAKVTKGEYWEARLNYQRDRAQLRRMVMKINALGIPKATWEVRIVFESPDHPGRVEITEIE